MIWGDILHVLVLLGIVATAFLVMRARDMINAAIVLAASSLLLSLEFFILRAPDVAIASAGVGAALTTAIFILAIKETRRKEDDI